MTSLSSQIVAGESLAASPGSAKCVNCQWWSRLGTWWGRCGNENRTAIETDDPGAGLEMTRKTFGCSAFSLNGKVCEPTGGEDVN